MALAKDFNYSYFSMDVDVFCQLAFVEKWQNYLRYIKTEKN